MFRDWFTNSTIAVPAELGPAARPWSGGLTSPRDGLLAALMAEVRPSKACAPATLPPANPVSRPADATRVAGPCAFAAQGGSPRGVVRCLLTLGADLARRASALASARRSTVPTRCRVIRPAVAPAACEVPAPACAAAAAAGTATETSA